MGEPSVEMIARALCEADGNDSDELWPFDLAGREDMEAGPAWEAYEDQARAVQALYAPALADARREGREEAARVARADAEDSGRMAREGNQSQARLSRVAVGAGLRIERAIRSLAPQQPREKDGEKVGTGGQA